MIIIIIIIMIIIITIIIIIIIVVIAMMNNGLINMHLKHSTRNSNQREINSHSKCFIKETKKAARWYY